MVRRNPARRNGIEAAVTTRSTGRYGYRRLWLKNVLHSPKRARTIWTHLTYEERAKVVHDAEAAVTLGDPNLAPKAPGLQAEWS
jgi:hypothetical protein